jgi:hypothetical protein
MSFSGTVAPREGLRIHSNDTSKLISGRASLTGMMTFLQAIRFCLKSDLPQTGVASVSFFLRAMILSRANIRGRHLEIMLYSKLVILRTQKDIIGFWSYWRAAQRCQLTLVAKSMPRSRIEATLNQLNVGCGLFSLTPCSSKTFVGEPYNVQHPKSACLEARRRTIPMVQRRGNDRPKRWTGRRMASVLMVSLVAPAINFIVRRPTSRTFCASN